MRKNIIIDSIVNALKEKGIFVKQQTIDYLYKKDSDFLKVVSRAIQTNEGMQLIKALGGN